ncbi:MAG: acyl-CoA dehydrogenase family protein [Steroidobacteraceae bacterium]
MGACERQQCDGTRRCAPGARAIQPRRDAAVEAATNKIIHTQAIQNIARAAMEFGCPSALLAGEPIELLWRTTMWESIGAGTSEIMTGIVARQRLGLGAAKK